MAHYALISIYVPMRDLEFGQLDDLVKKNGWAHRVEYPFMRTDAEFVPVFGVVKKPAD